MVPRWLLGTLALAYSGLAANDTAALNHTAVETTTVLASACPLLTCDPMSADACVVSSPITFSCPATPLLCSWDSPTDIVLNAAISMTSNSTCDIEVVWRINGSAHFTENASLAVTSLYLFANDFHMSSDGIIFAEHNMTIAVEKQLRIDQDASLVAGGEEPGKSGGLVNMSASSLILHGSIKASGGDGQCIDGVCTAGGSGGQVTLIYGSIAEEIGHIYVSGGANPLTLSSQVASYSGSRDDLDDTVVLPVCLTGAAGRLLRIHTTANGTREGVLLISNAFNSMNYFGDLLPLSKVRCAVTPMTLAEIDPCVKSVMLQNEALVHFEESEAWGLLGDSELILEDATLVVKANATLAVVVKQLVVRGTSTFVAPHGLNVTAAIVSIDFGAQVHLGYSATSTFTATDGIHIDGNITSNVAAAVWTNTDPTGQLILESKKDLVISGYVSMPTVYAAADASLVVSGELESRKRMNKTDPVEYQLCSTMHSAASILSNYTISLFSGGPIVLGLEAKPGALTGATLLLCTDHAVTVASGFRLSSSGFGYPANHGYGHGECLHALGSGGGYGGSGADSFVLRPAPVTMAVGGMSYGTRPSTGLLGSGGGCDGGGAGGGVIVLGAHHLNLNGTIAADGTNGVAGAGGGSGGFVSIVVPNGLSGHGALSASGGNASCAEERLTANTTQTLCGGGGGGGRLRLQGCTDFTECAEEFSGEYHVQGGVSHTRLPAPEGATGSYYGFPCPPGYGGLLCRACPIGTFKEERGSDECIPCRNAPPDAHYNTTGETSTECHWTCDPGYTGAHCLSPLEDFFEMFGGKLVVCVIALVVLLVIVAVGYVFKRDPYVKYRTGETDHLLVIPPAKRPWYHLRCCRVGHWIWPRVGYPKLQERDLKDHMARLYFAGNNTQEAPLVLRTTVPSALEPVLHQDAFAALAVQINKTLAFSTGGSILYKVVQVLCYPFASDVLLYRRHKKFNALKRLLAKYDHACMKGPRARALLNAVKVGYSADYSLAYLELLHKEYSSSSCVPRDGWLVGKPHLPLVLLFAGLGSYESPLCLDPNDLLVRSLPQAPELDAFIDDQWIEVVAELNALLRIVDTSNDAECAHRLQAVADFCLEQGVKRSLGGLQMALGRFYPHGDAKAGFQWGVFITTTKHEAAKYASEQVQSQQQARRHDYAALPFPHDNRESKRASAHRHTVVGAGIREAALLSPRTLAKTQAAPPPVLPYKPEGRRGGDWAGAIDDSLPVPGVLMSGAEFQQLGMHLMEKETASRGHRLWARLKPANVAKPPDTQFHGWGVFVALVVLVVADLVTTMGMLVNLKCVENGAEVPACTRSVVYPVLLIYPLAIVVAPVTGVISLVMGSAAFARKFALWNSCSLLSVAVAIVICYAKSDKLVALYVTRPLPLLPTALLLLKAGEAYVVNIYIADMEANRRRRGWRGLMKRRDSDTSSPPDSPYNSPVPNRPHSMLFLPTLKEPPVDSSKGHYGSLSQHAFGSI
ncbi:nucleoside diphosphate kinase [Achlya hypogyna]|uniref:Nucleoside diphosphate kinase n=1 Tax=Achlya hypogyna TaxID=1202772 RepID=A0A1V9Y508_ACHHY|nr:nucleoside diphosphate kinase [Achlya hypogyna]